MLISILLIIPIVGLNLILIAILLCSILVVGIILWFLMEANQDVKIKVEPQIKIEEGSIKKEEPVDASLAYIYKENISKCCIFDELDPNFRHEHRIFRSPIGTRPGDITEVLHNGVNHRCFTRSPTRLSLVSVLQEFSCKDFGDIKIYSGGSPAIMVHHPPAHPKITVYNANNI